MFAMNSSFLGQSWQTNVSFFSYTTDFYMFYIKSGALGFYSAVLLAAYALDSAS